MSMPYIFNSLEVGWVIPREIQSGLVGANPWTTTRVYRSDSENGTYALIATVAIATLLYEDTAHTFDERGTLYYLVKFVRADGTTQSRYYMAYVSLTPKEQRMVDYLKSALSPFLISGISDEQLAIGLQMGMNSMNIFPPRTSWTIVSFPASMEPLLHMSTLIFALFQRYLPIALTDVGYNDMGLTVTVDRGSKIQLQIDKIMKFYNELLSVAKLDYAHTGSGLGTLQMPISVGGNLNKGLLNVLDIFTSMGR